MRPPRPGVRYIVRLFTLTNCAHVFIIVDMRSSWENLGWSTLRTILVISLSVLVIGTSYGVAAHGAGLAWWQIVTIACLVMAGSSEFVFVGVLASGGVPLLGAVAGLVVNTRNFGYGLAVGQHLGPGLRTAFGAHLINDETTAVATVQPDAARSRAAFLWCGAGVALCWPAGAALGAVVGQLISSPQALGLDAAFPALLAALAVGALRDRPAARTPLVISMGVGAVFAVAVTPFAPAGVPILCALAGLAAARPEPAATT